MKSFILFFTALLALVTPLSAHPTGHEGGFIETARHFLSQPDHLLVWGAVLLCGAWLVWKLVRADKIKTDS